MIDIQKINSILIKEIPKYDEDLFQDTWVSILDNNITTELEIITLIKKIKSKLRNEYIKSNKLIRLDKPYCESGTKTYHEIIGENDICDTNYIHKTNFNCLKGVHYSCNKIHGIKCKYCGGLLISKMGVYHNRQRYFCWECRRKFANPDNPHKKRYPKSLIDKVRNLKEIGNSYRYIQRFIKDEDGILLSTETLFRWATNH